MGVAADRDVLKLCLETNGLVLAGIFGVGYLGREVITAVVVWFVVLAGHTLIAFMVSFVGYLRVRVQNRGFRQTWLVAGITIDGIIVGVLFLARSARTSPAFPIPSLVPDVVPDWVLYLLIAIVYALILYEVRRIFVGRTPRPPR